MEGNWAARYHRLGFTPEQMAFYDTPLAVRNSEAFTREQRREWKLLDEAVFEDLRISCMRGISGRSTSDQIIKDSMDPVKSMADGKHYDSKSQYYSSLKAHGSHIVEKGEQNGKNTELKGDFNVKQDLRKALHQHGILR